MTDEQLVREYVETESSTCFEQLMDRHVRKVRAMVYAMVLNDHDADDLTQDIFLRAARRMGRFSAKAKFSTWLYRVARNTVYDFLRKQKRSQSELREEIQDGACHRPTPAGALIGGESTQAIHSALASLAPHLRSAIMLTAIQGLSYRGAARVEACIPATLYWRVHEARRLLKYELKEIMGS